MIVQARTYVQYVWKGEVLPNWMIKDFPRKRQLSIQKAGTIIVRTS